MAAFMKIFKIESVVGDLVDRVAFVAKGSNFAFDNKNNAADQKQYVNATPHSRDRKLKEYVSRTDFLETPLK